MTRALPPLFFAILGISTAAAEELLSTPEALIARPKSLELNTPYVPPPGDPLEHHTAGFAKIMCSAVFITGLDPEFAAENVGYFTSPYAERAKVSKPAIDRANREVHIRLPSGVTRTARYLGSQGCVTLPVDETTVKFTPVAVKSGLPDPATTQGTIVVEAKEAGIEIKIAIVPEEWVIVPAPPGVVVDVVIGIGPEHRADPAEAAMSVAPPQVTIVMTPDGTRDLRRDGGARHRISQAARGVQSARDLT
jgi:hypothetical protein